MNRITIQSSATLESLQERTNQQNQELEDRQIQQHLERVR